MLVSGVRTVIKENRKKLRRFLLVLSGLFFVLSIMDMPGAFRGKKEKGMGGILEAMKAGTGVSDDIKTGFFVVLDPGHGGEDPGKVGSRGELEKDINLKIAKKVEKYLLLQDTTVVMTRREDLTLADSTQKGWKSRDLQKRVEIIEEESPDLVVSIHQNSFSQKNVKGAQVFYYKGKKEGKRAAELLQDSLVNWVDKTNHRRCKYSDTYYILRMSTVPAVLVECGFLSNPEEEMLLQQEEYQERIAYGISMGIQQYLRSKEGLE